MDRDEERRKDERRRAEEGRAVAINLQDYVIVFFVNEGRKGESVKDGNGLGGLSNIDIRGAFSRMYNQL